MKLRDRIALLLWRDVRDYDAVAGGEGDRHNISLRTRIRRFKKRIALGWAENWKWFVTTAIAVAGAILATVSMYVNLSKPGQQVNPHPFELALRCVEQGKCIIRIEPVPQDQNQVIPGTNGDRLNNDLPSKK